MRSIKGSLVGLVLAGILALAPTAAFAHGGGGGGGFGGGGGGHGGGGGGHGGGGFGGGAHFGGGSGHFIGGGGHFAGFAGRSFAGHSFAGPSFAQHQGMSFARHGDHFGDRDHSRDRDHFRHGGNFFFGDPFGYDYPYYGYDYPYYGYDYPYYGYYDDNAGAYAEGPSSTSQEIIIAVQKELTQLGYYHGQVDGLIGPQTERAIRWFQSVDKLPVTGQIDDPTLKALRIS